MIGLPRKVLYNWQEESESVHGDATYEWATNSKYNASFETTMIAQARVRR